jgi:hypothetical protein
MHRRAALAVLQQDENVDSIQSKAVNMLLAGHSPEEPYLSSLVLSRQMNQLNQIKDKARIFVPNSKLLMGVCDQSNKLKGGQVFVQFSTGFASTFILKGTVAVSKNPCVHPGGNFTIAHSHVLTFIQTLDC